MTRVHDPEFHGFQAGQTGMEPATAARVAQVYVDPHHRAAFVRGYGRGRVLAAARATPGSTARFAGSSTRFLI